MFLFGWKFGTLESCDFKKKSTAIHNPFNYVQWQSRNWDGGKQEYNTALTALRRVYPNATVIENCVDKYPIRVIVAADNHKKIWSGRQQDLFSKYASKRITAMGDIEAALQEFKQNNSNL